MILIKKINKPVFQIFGIVIIAFCAFQFIQSNPTPVKLKKVLALF